MDLKRLGLIIVYKVMLSRSICRCRVELALQDVKKDDRNKIKPKTRVDDKS